MAAMKFFRSCSPISAGTSGARSSRSLSVALALFLFASLRTRGRPPRRRGEVRQRATARHARTRPASCSRCPLGVRQPARGGAGRQSVTWANWFGGKYGDGKRFFAQFAVDREVVPRRCIRRSSVPERPEGGVPPRAHGGASSARGCMEMFGWKLGQNVTSRARSIPGDWTFTIRGVYTPTDPAISDDAMMFHHEYLDENARAARATPAGTSCRSTTRQRGRGSRRRSTISSGIRRRPPRPGPSRRSTRASRPCGATSAC